MEEKIYIHAEDPAVRVLKMEKYPESLIYLLIPSSYRENTPCGLFFFMHGGDASSVSEQPYNSYLNKNTGCLRPHLENFPYIVAAPSALKAVDGKRWNRKGVSTYIMDVIGEIKRYFNIDTDRMILGGHSMGGFGAYHQGALLNEHFAALWCSAGAFLAEDFRSMEGCGIYLAHGKYDCALHYRGVHKEPRHHDWCGVSFARAAHELMNRYGISHVYDEHEGGHTLDWEPAQMAFCRFLQWAQKQKRDPYPARCAVVTPNGSADPDLEECVSSRYLQILDRDASEKITLDRIVLTGPNIAWTIDEFNAQSYYLDKMTCDGAFLQVENQGNNLFDVKSLGVSEFLLRLHPAMADLSKPVRLCINGRSPLVIENVQTDRSHEDYTASIRVRISQNRSGENTEIEKG